MVSTDAVPDFQAFLVRKLHASGCTAGTSLLYGGPACKFACRVCQTKSVPTMLTSAFVVYSFILVLDLW